MKILVIEDDAMIRVTLCDILTLHGYEVIEVTDGPSGVREVAHSHPDLVVCDVGLPKMDGYKVLETVRQLPEGRELPFIFLTAMAGREDLRRGMQLGADDYLTKPFSEKELIGAITARLQRQLPFKERVGQLLDERNRSARAEWSHELLTPLAGIEGGLALLEAEAEHLKPHDVRELVAMIRVSAERQRRLATKLVRYFEFLQSPRAKRAADAVEISSHLAATAERIARAMGRAADLRVRCEPAEVVVESDDLAAALGELMENALKFSRVGEEVEIRGIVVGDEYAFEVLDQGEGMSSEECACLGAFVQIGRSRREQQGLGLGVALARLALARSSGTLELAPRKDRRGLVARVRLRVLGPS